MALLARIGALILVTAVLVVGGATAGARIAPHVNAHNDWGATWMLCVAAGGLAGLVAAGVLWWRTFRND